MLPMKTPDARHSSFSRLRWLVPLVLLTLWLAAPLAAQPAQPYIGFAKERYRLFVFGDKMATGLLAGLWRVLKDNPRVVARGRFRAGSGLSRPRHHDWRRNIEQILETQDVDIAVILLGVNDARDIILAERRVAFGGAEWRRLYGARVDAVMRTLRERQVALYWVGLPPMRDAALDAAVREIEAVIAARARANGVRFISVREHFSAPGGGFAESGPDVNGQIVRLRARNGIHFIRPGNTRLAMLVWDVIRKDIRAAAHAPAAGALAALATPGQPLVGRATPRGEPEYLPVEMLPGRDVVYLATGLGKGAAFSTLEALRQAVAPGSAAARLFTEGLTGAAPADRWDNFSLPRRARRNERAR